MFLGYRIGNYPLSEWSYWSPRVPRSVAVFLPFSVELSACTTRQHDLGSRDGSNRVIVPHATDPFMVLEAISSFLPPFQGESVLGLPPTLEASVLIGPDPWAWEAFLGFHYCQSFEALVSPSTSPNRFMKALWTSSVRSLACRLRPFLTKASREHSCSRIRCQMKAEEGRKCPVLRLTRVMALPPKAAKPISSSAESFSPPISHSSSR